MTKEKWTTLISLSEKDCSIEDIKLTCAYLCYDINLTITQIKDKIKIIITNKPQFDEVYHILLHYQLIVNGRRIIRIMDDFWNGKECELINCLYNDTTVIDTLKFEIEMVEIKSGENLKEKSCLRNFKVNVGGESFYFNIKQLEEYGGKLYNVIKENLDEEKMECEFNEILPNEFRIFIEACFKYNSLNINRRNYLQLLPIATTLQAHLLLRSLETFLITNKEIHQIRKLEHAITYRMSRLCDVIIRSYENNRVKMLSDLHQYMEKNNETLDEQHPMILQIFDIGSNHVIIN
uniref:BTB domain-containing protein n=1 Tax=Parastrongyloides trichosuri TaxID=131310 RepID=A0A0N4ZR85_PARTI